MAQRIQLRRGTAAEWSAANPVLAVGEPGVESDTGRQKLGDGVTAWNSRPYASKGDKGDQGAPGIADDASVAQQVTNGTATKAALSATYAPAFPASTITYNADGTVATVTDNGITTTYTYNADGTVATDTRNGVTRNYGYTNGNLTSITKAA